jgi:hypothetical protein
MADRLTKFGDTISGIEDFIETPYYKNLDDSDKGIIDECLNILNNVLEQVDYFSDSINGDLKVFNAIIDSKDVYAITGTGRIR